MGGAIHFCSLGSSSTYGNAYLVEVPGRARVLVDCGVPLRRLERELADLGIHPSTLDGILISHEHSDHINALKIKTPFPQRYRIPVYAPPAVWQAMRPHIGALDSELCRTIRPWDDVSIGGLQVCAFLKSHDTGEPVSFVLRTETEQIGIVTDLGRVDNDAIELLYGSNYLIFESNHDVEMQRCSGRPPELIRRVLSDAGHLSNQQAARALARIATRETRVVLLAHLSLDCNRPDLALAASGEYLRGTGFSGELAIAPAKGRSRYYGKTQNP